MAKVVKLTETKDFTMSALANYLNDKYGEKKSGEKFNARDIQQYMRQGKIPNAYGGSELELIKNDIIGIKILRIK